MAIRKRKLLNIKRPKIKWAKRRNQSPRASNHNRYPKEPSFGSKVIRVMWFIWRMPGKWAFFIDGQEDPRRFEDWKMMSQVLKAECEQGFIRPEAYIVCRRVPNRPKLNHILWWAIKRSW